MDQLLGKYQRIRRLGKGGFAEVYLAQDELLGRHVAVKLMHDHLDPSYIGRFDSEVRLLKDLKHPHIVSLLDYGFSLDDRPFLVMEYAQGGTLRDQHPKGTCLPLKTVVEYVSQIASALHYAHDAFDFPLIHRDIKPENVFVRADGTVMLGDFGIAIIKEVSITRSIIGTPAYMAPEQFDGDPCPQSDQYALAVIAYELLAGTTPFAGRAESLGVQHALKTPSSLLAKLPELPRNIERVLFKALAKKPEKRYQTIGEFAEAFNEAAGLAPPSLPWWRIPLFHRIQNITDKIAQSAVFSSIILPIPWIRKSISLLLSSLFPLLVTGIVKNQKYMVILSIIVLLLDAILALALWLHPASRPKQSKVVPLFGPLSIGGVIGARYLYGLIEAIRDFTLRSQLFVVVGLVLAAWILISGIFENFSRDLPAWRRWLFTGSALLFGVAVTVQFFPPVREMVDLLQLDADLRALSTMLLSWVALIVCSLSTGVQRLKLVKHAITARETMDDDQIENDKHTTEEHQTTKDKHTTNVQMIGDLS